MAYDKFTAKMVRKCSELEQALAEKDRQIAHLKESVAHYDRWLSIGVYYTNEEFFERVLKPKQQLMEKAVRFAEGYKGKLEKEHGGKVFKYGQYELVAQFLQSPEVQAWKEQQK